MSYNVSETSFKVGANAPYVVTGTDVALADGGTGSSTAAGARTNLGLVIGTDVQAFDAELAAIAGLVSAADKVPYFTGSGTAAVADFSVAGRALVDDADAAAQRTTLGLGTIATQASASVSITGGTMSGVTITSLPAPVSANDAARKADVDAAKQGLDAKDSVRLATAAALPAYTRTGDVITATAVGVLTVDGVATVINNRILVKDGAAGSDNGLYFVSTEGTAGVAYVLTRTADADTSAKVTTGLYVFASEGTVNADASFVLTTNDAITLNTTALTFSQFSGAGQITAGNGLTKTGNTLDVGAGNGISVAADSVAVALDGATLTVGGPGLKVSTGGVNTNELANNAVDSAKLANAAVSAGKIAVGGVSASNQFAASVVDSAAIAAQAVTLAKLARPASTNVIIGQGAGADAIAAALSGDVTMDAAGAVTIANNAITSAKINAGAVTAGKYGAGSIATGDIANNAVTPAKADLAQAWNHTGLVSAKGGFEVKVTVSATNYTALTGDTVIGITDTTAARTVTLYAISGNTGKVLIIKDMSGAAATNNITIDGNAAETIDGAATKVINTNYGSMTLVCDVSGWVVV